LRRGRSRADFTGEKTGTVSSAENTFIASYTWRKTARASPSVVEERGTTAEPTLVAHCLMLPNDEAPNNAIEYLSIWSIDPIVAQLSL
jgi:hypothetical protein